jgi:hypothetical protein
LSGYSRSGSTKRLPRLHDPPRFIEAAVSVCGLLRFRKWHFSVVERFPLLGRYRG